MSATATAKKLNGTGTINIATSGVLTRNEQTNLQKQHTFQPNEQSTPNSKSASPEKNIEV